MEPLTGIEPVTPSLPWICHCVADFFFCSAPQRALSYNGGRKSGAVDGD